MSTGVIVTGGKPVTCTNCDTVEWTNVTRVGNKITANCRRCRRPLELTVV